MRINFFGDLIIGDHLMKIGFGLDSTHSLKGYNGLIQIVNNILCNSDFDVSHFESII
jgi:hypothetical protein